MSFVIVWNECTAPYNKDGLSISWLWRVGDYEAEDYIMIIIILYSYFDYLYRLWDMINPWLLYSILLAWTI